MSIDHDPLDETASNAASGFDSANPVGFHPARLGDAVHRADAAHRTDAAHLGDVPSRRGTGELDTTRTLADLRKQVQMLTHQLAEERAANLKWMALSEFNRDLQSAPDPERASQTMAKTLQHIFNCDIISIYNYHPAEQRMKLLASAGAFAYLSPGALLPDEYPKIIEQAICSQAIISSLGLAFASEVIRTEPLDLGASPFPGYLVVPLTRNKILRGLIILASADKQAFCQQDFPVAAAASEQLLNVWEYAQQNETLTEFIQTVTMMSVVQEAGSLMEMIASIARRTLGASFAMVATRNQQEWLMRGSGHAPRLFHSLQNGAANFLEEAVRSPYTFHLRDLRQDSRAANIQLDNSEQCSVLASPIRINGATTGILMAFGKNSAAEFNSADVFLAELLASHAAVNLESCYLNQELRSNLKTTQLLHDLSLSVAQAENLTDAARAIARTAYRLLQAHKCGLLLFSPNGRVEAEVRFPTDDPNVTHPYRLIQQAMDSRQAIYLSDDNELAYSVTPIQTLRRCYGALWMEFSEDNEESRHPTDEIRILINQAAVALERSILLEETLHQAEEIDRAYQNLKASYEHFMYGLTKALDARDRDTEGHSVRVEELSVKIGMEMGLSRGDLQALKHGALLHDIGKIGVPDGILHKPGPLNDQEWETMRQHPTEGVKIIQEIPMLQDALPVIAFHQERWDGSGYPAKLRGTEIPLLARIFAVVDVFDALTSKRPYRTAQTYQEALDYLESKAGTHFDPEVVKHFSRVVRANLDLKSSSDPDNKAQA